MIVAGARADALVLPVLPSELDLVPERVFPLAEHRAWTTRLSVTAADGLASLLLNGLVILFLAHIGWPASTSAAAPEPISIEVVDSIPGEKTAAHTGSSPAAPGASATVAQTARASAEAPSAPEDKPAESFQASTPAPVSEPAKPEPPKVATPAPLDHPQTDPRSHLVEAPADPHRTTTQIEKAVPARATPEPDHKPHSAEPAQPPAVISSRDSKTETPAAQPKPSRPEPTAEEKREAANTATLAAVLPFSHSIMADPAQASLSGQGTASAEEYRGAVYGAFKKAESVVEQARARNLRGQTVVAFTIDDTGALTNVGVAVSSGNPEVDQAALAIIRQSAPYPPPPPGAPHHFSPAIALGLDQ